MILGTKWQGLKLLWEMEPSENYLTFLQIAAYFQGNILKYADDFFEVMCPFFPYSGLSLTGVISNIIFYSTLNSFHFLMLRYPFIT